MKNLKSFEIFESESHIKFPKIAVFGKEDYYKFKRYVEVNDIETDFFHHVKSEDFWKSRIFHGVNGPTNFIYLIDDKIFLWPRKIRNLEKFDAKGIEFIKYMHPAYIMHWNNIPFETLYSESDKIFGCSLPNLDALIEMTRELAELNGTPFVMDIEYLKRNPLKLYLLDDHPEAKSWAMKATGISDFGIFHKN